MKPINFGAGAPWTSKRQFAWRTVNGIHPCWRCWSLRFQMVICLTNPKWNRSMLEPVRHEHQNGKLLNKTIMKSINQKKRLLNAPLIKSINFRNGGPCDSKWSIAWQNIHGTCPISTRWPLKLQMAICLTNASRNPSILEKVSSATPNCHLPNKSVMTSIHVGNGAPLRSKRSFAQPNPNLNEIYEFWNRCALNLQTINCLTKSQWNPSMLEMVGPTVPNNNLLNEFQMKFINFGTGAPWTPALQFAYQILIEIRPL